MVVTTAPTRVNHPWQVEWNRGSEVRCILGIINDYSQLSTAEWQPRNFPKGMSQSLYITSSSVSQRTFKKEVSQASSKPYSTGIKSGSVAVYSKSVFGRVVTADFAQGASHPAVAPDAQKGYVKWKEEVLLEKHTSVYVVLHSTDGKWCLSLVDEADLTSDDIKIAVFKAQQGRHIADWEMLQLWKSDLMATPPLQRHFFEVSTSEPTSGTFRIRFAYDEIADWNTYAAGGNGGIQWGTGEGSLPPEQVWRFLVPTISGTPLAFATSESPYFDITQSTYFYLEFTRNGTWTPGSNGGIGSANDKIQSVEIKSGASPLSDITFSYARYPIAYVKIQNSKIVSIEMLSQMKLHPGSKMTAYAWGGLNYTEWDTDYSQSPPVLVMTNPGNIYDPQFAIYQKYTFMGGNAYSTP